MKPGEPVPGIERFWQKMEEQRKPPPEVYHVVSMTGTAAEIDAALRWAEENCSSFAGTEPWNDGVQFRFRLVPPVEVRRVECGYPERRHGKREDIAFHPVTERDVDAFTARYLGAT
jgi:hypothetical protein